jgi:SatD family (SatD)
MGEMKDRTSWVLIGDLVGSRRAADRLSTHERLAAVLADANDELDRRGSLVDALRVTAGDEFQGTVASLGAAVSATLRLRVGLLPEADVRCGIGYGPVQVLQEEPRVEDGAGWWAARAAIERVAEQAGRAALRGLRTAYVAAPEASPAAPDHAAVNAALMTRDHLVSALDERSLSVLDGMLRGRTQKDLAEDLGITPSAVSQRVRSDGLAVLVATDELLRDLR